MNRIIGTIFLIFTILILNACSKAPSKEQPNVLFVVVDDWNDWIGILNSNPNVKTPNVDKLASEGFTFTNAYCASPLCNPSRTSILTGKMPSNTGIYKNNQWWIPALPDIVTLPKYFKDNGYHTVGAGKIFHHTAGFNDPKAWNEYYFWNKDAVTNGLDEMWHRPVSPHPQPAPQSIITNRTKRNFDYAKLNVPDSIMPDSKTAEWVANFLKNRHDKPFFLAIGMFRPHIEWYVPKKYFDMYPLDSIRIPDYLENDLDDIPEIGRSFALDDGSDHDFIKKSGIWKELVQAYLACITFSDAQVGKVLKALKDGPNKSNTIVVFLSDHGYHLGEKDHWHKSTLWKRALHVPLIFKLPGITNPGVECNKPVSLIDLYPTLLDLCNFSVPDRLDGKSIVPLLENPDRVWNLPVVSDFLYGNYSVISSKYHLINYRDGENELYDIYDDPNEWTNLSQDSSYTKVIENLMQYVPKDALEDALEKSQFVFNPRDYSFSNKKDEKVFTGFSSEPDYSWTKTDK